MDSEFSLRTLILTKIAIQIYRHPDIKTLERERCEVIRYIPAEIWEPIAKEKLSSLNLPWTIHREVIALMIPLSVEIDDWEYDHYPILYNRLLKLPIDYIWKENGTIDRIETAKNFIKGESHDISLRFRMTCVYWLEEEAKKLWQEMSETTRSSLSVISVCNCKLGWENVVKDWIAFIRSGAVDWRQHTFPHSLTWYCQYRVVIQSSLLQELSQTEQFCVFEEVMKEGIPTHTKTFCLTQMNEKQFENISKKEPAQVFKALLNRPFHSQFQSMVDCIFTYLSEKDFVNVLHEMICEHIIFKTNDYDYVKLLRDLWDRSPDSYKEYVESSEFFHLLKMALEFDYKTPFLEKCPCESDDD
ncbi:uncharacterized protein NPIL_648111 [Nephila pilipes]|uniref:Uncharacterized protein n=1 Tax=Nephila pilipes TaxID=299642 RepID=A0A8X6IAH1_NEPPI|nr:uncharacterized protein NPIL_648111 [Nephila pilipes]